MPLKPKGQIAASSHAQPPKQARPERSYGAKILGIPVETKQSTTLGRTCTFLDSSVDLASRERDCQSKVWTEIRSSNILVSLGSFEWLIQEHKINRLSWRQESGKDVCPKRIPKFRVSVIESFSCQIKFCIISWVAYDGSMYFGIDERESWKKKKKEAQANWEKAEAKNGQSQK